MELEAALAGGGISLALQCILADDLMSGSLGAPVGFHPYPDGFKAVVPDVSNMSRPVRRFMEWAMDQADDIQRCIAKKVS